jgi:hypothetical protein
MKYQHQYIEQKRHQSVSYVQAHMKNIDIVNLIAKQCKSD